MNINQIEKYLKAFTEDNNIKGFTPSTIQQIAEMNNNGDLWNLVCNLVEAYYQNKE
jgi:hypothetical protein